MNPQGDRKLKQHVLTCKRRGVVASSGMLVDVPPMDNPVSPFWPSVHQDQWQPAPGVPVQSHLAMVVPASMVQRNQELLALALHPQAASAHYNLVVMELAKVPQLVVPLREHNNVPFFFSCRTIQDHLNKKYLSKQPNIFG